MNTRKSLTYLYSHFIRIFFIVCLIFHFQSRFLTAKAETEINTPSRNPKWAALVEKPGLPNFHKVNNDLYRGAQPSAEGMQELKKLGITTVLNLRSMHSDRDELGDTGLAYIHIRMMTWHPKEESLVRFLQIVTDKTRTPVFVHCLHGADRTGVMIATYRLVVEGWTKEEAIEEMTKGGFGFHSFWFSLVPFLENLDVEDIRKKAGLQE